MTDTFYPSKLLLFGEYTVIKGSKALAVPFPTLGAHWKKDKNKAQAYNHLWDRLLYYFNAKPEIKDFLNLVELQRKLTEGWYVESNIPVGYGLGSSGALCAAIFNQFNKGLDGDTPESMKTKLALMESFFHGQSSGIDPLVSYLNQPIILENNQCQVVPDSPLPFISSSFFLLDTDIKRETAPLVQTFLQACQNQQYEAACANQLSQENNTAISALLDENMPLLNQAFRRISQLQWELFQPMIPAAFKNIWKAGLDSDSYYLKLCGAGGGGFLLGFAKNPKQTQELSRHSKILHLSEK